MNFPSITKKEFERNLSSNFSFENQPYIGICVSGGSDSMALLLLMREWIKKLNGKILAIHFDHNLRVESNFESKVLEKKVKKLGVDFTKITWNHGKIDSRILEIARNERYKKIISLCKKLKIINLMTAHNLDDNLETFIMRKKRDSISLGLSFANLKKKSEACNVFYELEVKYKTAPKNVLERANSEKKKLDCPKE